MNERVWLQFSRPFVNKRRAAVCVLCVSLLAACGGDGETSADSDVATPPEAVENMDAETLEIPAIWETQARETSFEAISILSSAAGGVWAAGADASGAVTAFDLDGGVLAESRGDGQAIRLGDGANVVGAATFLSPALQDDGTLVGVVSDLNAGGAGVVQIEAPEKYDAICAGPPQDEAIPVALAAGDQISRGQISVADDAVRLDIQSTQAFDGPVSACALSDKDDLVISGGAMFKFSDDATPLVETGAISSLAMATTEAKTYAIWLDAAGALTAMALNAPEATPGRLSISAGLSVSAPTQISALAARSGRIGPDYGGGLLVVTGDYEDGAGRLTFVDIASIADALE